MAKYVAINTAYTYHVDFMVDGELVAPTSATIKITNNAGSVVGSFNNANITLSEGDVGANILIPQTDNQVTLPNEIRYIEVKFVFDGVTYTINDFYFLKEDVRFPLSPTDVLFVLGMTGADVDASMIDILSAYNSVKSDVGDLANLDAILEGGTSLLPTLIDAVKYKAAMQVSVGAQNSLMQMEQADNTLYRRFMEIDFAAIDAKVAGLYSDALYLLQGSPISSAPVISLMVVGTDPVTGA